MQGSVTTITVMATMTTVTITVTAISLYIVQAARLQQASLLEASPAIARRRQHSGRSCSSPPSAKSCAPKYAAILSASTFGTGSHAFVRG